MVIISIKVLIRRDFTEKIFNCHLFFSRLVTCESCKAFFRRNALKPKVKFQKNFIDKFQDFEF